MPPRAAVLGPVSESLHGFDHGGNILGRANVFEGHGEEFVPGIAVLAHCGGVYREKAQRLPIEDPGRMRVVVKQFAVPLVALPEQFFRPSTLSDIAGDLRESTQLASPV